mgnify:CR=1 FL=1
MRNILEKMVMEYAKDMSVLVVDDDEMTLEIYKEVYSNFFYIVDTASDGDQAYKMWSSGKRKYDLVLTDLMMPNIDGFELIDKIRLKSPEQHIIVLTAIEDINEMRNIIELGIDGILGKPYNQEKMFQILHRVLKVIHNDKVLKRQTIQLRLLAQDNIKAKTALHEKKIELKTTPIPEKKRVEKKVEKSTSENEKPAEVKDNKYHTRASIHGESADEFTKNLDYYDMDRVEIFQDNIENYQNIACEMGSLNAEETKEDLNKISQGLYELIDLLNHFGMFTVTAEATTSFVNFVENIEAPLLEDKEKKEMFVDGLMAMLEDLNNWIEMVFVQKQTDNINYFDASFANTCLELETIFSPVEMSDDDDSMDFF